MNNAKQEPAIAVRGLAKKFAEVRAVDGLDFEVFPHQIFGLVGPDGAGKTTTLRMLAGVMRPDAGEITVGGNDVVRQAERAKHHLSYMPQRFGLYEDLTVDENIRFYADLFGVRGAEREPRSEQLLQAAGMAEFRRRLAGKLSGGMKQKLGLVCALIHTPRVILLDEPTTGVDPVSRRDFWRILYSLLDEGVAILISTAYLDEAERCHRVALLHEGRLLFCDTPDQLKARLSGSVVAVTGPEPRRLRDALQDTSGLEALLLTGDGVHLVLERGHERISDLRERLCVSATPFDDVLPVTASIEDLFVHAVTTEKPR